MADTAPMGKDEAIDLLRDALEHYDGLAPNTITAREALRITEHLAPSAAPEVDVRYEFERWMSQRGDSAVYIGDGLYSSGAVSDQAEAFAAGVESGRAALASRPAEVDDEGLPPLPAPLQRDDTEHGVDYFTAEQYRQGQRDAVAADRARRMAGGGAQ